MMPLNTLQGPRCSPGICHLGVDNLALGRHDGTTSCKRGFPFPFNQSCISDKISRQCTCIRGVKSSQAIIIIITIISTTATNRGRLPKSDDNITDRRCIALHIGGAESASYSWSKSTLERNEDENGDGFISIKANY